MSVTATTESGQLDAKRQDTFSKNVHRVTSERERIRKVTGVTSPPDERSRRGAVPSREPRDAVLDAAADAVVARGGAGLRLSAVAARAGVSRQTLYNVFGGKD